ncbi:MAG: ATP-binding protein [Mariniphaga sp.]
MAKRTSKINMVSENKIKKIVITGPESTGKTELAKALSLQLNVAWIPEYARSYIENLGRAYEYEDVVQIARYQIAQETKVALTINRGLLIFDTWLIITKIWFDLVYEKCPEWVVEHIHSSRIDLFLVCNTDLPWIADPVRENGGDKREHLLKLYCDEIRSFGFKYELIDGIGNERTVHAINALAKHGLNLSSY